MFEQQFAYVYGETKPEGYLKKSAEDFIVTEHLEFEPDGSGEHVYISVRKRNQNTNWVIKQIADALGVKPFEIGYAGLKDRRAVTTQWFSIAEKYYDENKLAKVWNNDIQCLSITAHTKKLKTIHVKKNRFEIRITELTGDYSELQNNIQNVILKGAPNYFGEQRFGIERQNLTEVEQTLFKRRKLPKFKKSILLSAARSWLFNVVLSRRITDDNWQTVLPGDVLLPENGDDVISGPLWGRGRLQTKEQAAELELDALSNYSHWCDQLEHMGLNQDRRALTFFAEDLKYIIDSEKHELHIQFELKKGCYATSLLRELVNCQVVKR